MSVSKGKKVAPFSIADRLRHGCFTVSEAKALAGISNTKFYNDRKRGLITTFRRGMSSFVKGPDLAAYMDFDLSSE